jgi:hypothetical protein
MRNRSRTSILIGLLAVSALLALAYIFAARPWIMRWGATDQELAMALPGDPEMPPGAVISTRAVTIHAPAAAVWPWVDQLGQERGGFYSYDWLENLFGASMHNANAIAQEWQGRQVGDRVSYMGDGPPGTYAEVTQLEPGRMLTLAGWTFFLQPVDEETTRLIVRYPFVRPTDLASGAFYYGIFEPAHFVMESGMMMGIKQRAEASWRQQNQTGVLRAPVAMRGAHR